MFVADPVAAFRNIRRALKPAGRLVFIAWRTPEENRAEGWTLCERHVDPFYIAAFEEGVTCLFCLDALKQAREAREFEQERRQARFSGQPAKEN